MGTGSPGPATIVSSRFGDAATGRVEHQLKGHTGIVWNAAFSPTGIASPRSARTRRSGSGTRQPASECTRSLATLATSGAWRLAPMAAGSPQVALTRPCGSGTRQAARNSAPFEDTLARSTTSPLALTAPFPACFGRRRWNRRGSGGPRVREEAPALKGYYDEAGTMAYSPDGAWLAAGDNDNRVRVWDALTGQTIYSLQGHTGRVHGVAFSSDGQRIASASHDKTRESGTLRPAI